MSTLRYILSFGLFTLSIALLGQGVQFTASAPASIRVGQQFEYTVRGNKQGSVQLPSSSDFEVLGGPFTNYSSSTQWVNGKMKAQTTASYTYIFRGRKAGGFSLPPASIKVKKETYKTNSVSISVVDNVSSSGTSNPQQPVFLKVIPSKRSVYVGEQFVAELKVYTSVNTRPTAGLKEVPYEGFYKHAVDADQSSSRENVGGVEHVTQVLQRHVLIPQKSGKIRIEQFDSEWALPQKVSNQRSRNAFDPFFDRMREVPEIISTKPVTIDVKPLPANAPDGFTGGVGKFEFNAELKADKPVVNDAISFVVKISGTGNISLIGAPKIDFPPDHDVYETTKSSKISTSGNRVSGFVTFEYPIVVRHAGNFRIAPVTFTWFDPATKKYSSVTTDEFNFTVEKGEATEDSGQVYISGLRAEDVKNIGTDILDIKRQASEFSVIGKSPLSKNSYWLGYLIMFIVFITLILILPIYFRQKADVRLIRNRKANKMARSRLKIADKARKQQDGDKFFEETEKAIWGYTADKLNIELSSLSRDKISEVLSSAGISESVQEELLRIMDDCEFSRYAPSSEKSDMNKLYTDAIRLIQILEQNIHVR
jgi:hypothetical protein